jgi:hypothetical protein
MSDGMSLKAILGISITFETDCIVPKIITLSLTLGMIGISILLESPRAFMNSVLYFILYLPFKEARPYHDGLVLHIRPVSLLCRICCAAQGCILQYHQRLHSLVPYPKLAPSSALA